MKRSTFIDKILIFEKNKNLIVVEKFLDRLDTVLSCYDDFMDEIFSDIFYELYLNEDRKPYLEIATNFNISTSKVFDVKIKIEAYARKLILKEGEFHFFKKYL
ncbi:hypothetical protein HDR67_00555 [bacterium]|nr:hypothetical protein [bacterium]